MEEHFNIIKLDAIGSTNEYLKKLSGEKLLQDFTVIVTKHQSKGRGQMGGDWQSDRGKNLTFSILKYFDGFQVEHQFDLSMSVSLAIQRALIEVDVPDVSVKWPNDILSGNFKICGILIENILATTTIQRSIIGIGLNVNQTAFQGLERAGSLKSVSGRDYDLDGLLHKILLEVKRELVRLKSNSRSQLLNRYQESIFRKDKVSAFKDVDKKQFNGLIRGVSLDGKLQVQLEDDSLKAFGFKEVTLLY